MAENILGFEVAIGFCEVDDSFDEGNQVHDKRANNQQRSEQRSEQHCYALVFVAEIKLMDAKGTKAYRKQSGDYLAFLRR